MIILKKTFHATLKLLIFLSFPLLTFSLKGQTVPNLLRQADQIKMNHWVDSVFNSLTPQERIGQLIMVIANPQNSTYNKTKIENYLSQQKIGGILFYKGTALEQATLCNWLQQKSKIPLLVAADGEWGLSMRLTGTTRFPKNMLLGAIEDIHLIEDYGKEMARQCKEMGIHVNFAPDIDINSNWRNPVIGTRSFGENVQSVSDRGIAYAEGLEKGGVIAVGKHFPGHGNTSTDSHRTLPTVNRTREELEQMELYPFREFINKGFAGILTAHLSVPALEKDPTLPTSLSPTVVTQLLKKEMGFSGLCFTDALAMKGATSKKHGNVSVAALKAGNDILLAPAVPSQAFKAIVEAVKTGVLSQQEIDAHCRKVLRYKFIAGLNHSRPLQLKGLYKRLNTPHAAWMAAKLNQEGMTLLKNEDHLIPLKNLANQKIAVLSLGRNPENIVAQTALNYAKVDAFALDLKSSAATINQTYAKLKNYDIVLCALHSSRIQESAALRLLAKQTNLIYLFTIGPYSLMRYKASIANAKAVVMGYEDTPLAQKYATQLVFGGIAAKGKLPVSIPGLFFSGTGLFTQKVRLGYQQPEEVGLNPYRIAQLDSLALLGLQKKAYPGCQILVAKDGWIIYDKQFGYLSDKQKQHVDDKTTYDLASMSKTIGTLLAVMKTYDLKKFKLNDPISSYVTPLKNSNKKTIRIKELLYHESGIVPTINFYSKAINHQSYKGSLYSPYRNRSHPIHFDYRTYVRNDFSFLPEVVSKTPKKGYDIHVAKNFYVNHSFRDSIMQMISDSKIRRRGHYKYSCINFILLKMMVENQMKMGIDQLLRSDFYDRLGAWHTGFNPLQRLPLSILAPTENDQFIRCQLLRGYVHDESAAFQGGVSGNAGVFANAGDIAKISQLFLNKGTYGGERYLSEKTSTLFTNSKSTISRRGLGFDKPYMGHPKLSPCGALCPASTYGHTGYTGTAFWIDPDHQLIFIMLCNRVNPTRTNKKLYSLNLRTQMQDLLYKAMSPKKNN